MADRRILFFGPMVQALQAMIVGVFVPNDPPRIALDGGVDEVVYVGLSKFHAPKIFLVAHITAGRFFGGRFVCAIEPANPEPRRLTWRKSVGFDQLEFYRRIPSVASRIARLVEYIDGHIVGSQVFFQLLQVSDQQSQRLRLLLPFLPHPSNPPGHLGFRLASILLGGFYPGPIPSQSVVSLTVPRTDNATGIEHRQVGAGSLANLKRLLR